MQVVGFVGVMSPPPSTYPTPLFEQKIAGNCGPDPRINEDEAEDAGKGRHEVQPGEGLDPDEIYFLSDPNGRLQKLGRGSFGSVYKAVWQGQVVAVKVCREKLLPEAVMQKFYKEISILKQCQHPHIVQLLSACSWKVRAVSFAAQYLGRLTFVPPKSATVASPVAEESLICTPPHPKRFPGLWHLPLTVHFSLA